MANLDKIRVIKDGVSTDYEIGGGSVTPSDIELPIDYDDIYDTEEYQIGWYAVTGGYKPIYKKIIATQLSYSTNAVTQIDISTLNVDSIIKMSTVYESTTGNTIVSDDSKYVSLYGTSSTVNVSCDAGGGTPKANTGIVWIKYTKTIDDVVIEIPKQTIPGIVQKYIDTVPVGTELNYDGEEAPSGWEEVDDPNTYSTEEMKIATWIDGKPLYRKTIVSTNALPTNTDVEIGTINDLETVTKIDKIIRSSSGDLYFNNYIDANSDSRGLQISINPQSGKVKAKSVNESWATPLIIVHVEYTKTTDQGGNE